MNLPVPNLGLSGAAALAAALTFSGTAQAQAQLAPVPPQTATPSSAPFGLLSQPQSAGGARRYATPDGSVRFVFDRSSGGRVALVRFEGDPEVHVLRPVGAARGDEIYRTESGDIQLRVTPHGGVIVYTNALRTGAPAAEEARVAPLAPQVMQLAALQQRLRELQVRSARAGRPLSFEVHLDDPAGAGVALDAAERAVEGLARVPASVNVRRVVIVVGAAPRARLQGDAVMIQVAPRMGYAGRPSSVAIRDVATGVVQGPERQAFSLYK